MYVLFLTGFFLFATALAYFALSASHRKQRQRIEERLHRMEGNR